MYLLLHICNCRYMNILECNSRHMNIVAHIPEYLVNQYRHHVNITNRWHQTNEFTTMVRSPINFVLGYCIAAAPDPA